MKTALTNCTILSGGKEIREEAVLINDGIIQSIVPPASIPSEYQRLDLNGNYLAPGLIDLQIYGSGGKLFGALPSVNALEQLENDLLAQGTTGFLATAATNTDQVVESAILAAKTYRKTAKGNFLGLHLEGPFLNPAKRGAHPAELIRKGDIDTVKKWIDLAEGEIRMMTVAPELQDDAFLSYLSDNHIIVSCGHSNATYAEAMAFPDTVQTATHLFNAMPSLHHREPGLVAALFEKKIYASIIADGIHVDFAMIRLAKELLGNRLFLITDAVTEASEGVYQHVNAGDRYTMPDGTLSGSNLSMLKAVQNCVEKIGISLTEAINMASLHPAELMGDGNKYGKIETGYHANLFSFTPAYAIDKVFMNGALNSN